MHSGILLSKNNILKFGQMRYNYKYLSSIRFWNRVKVSFDDFLIIVTRVKIGHVHQAKIRVKYSMFWPKCRSQRPNKCVIFRMNTHLDPSILCLVLNGPTWVTQGPWRLEYPEHVLVWTHSRCHSGRCSKVGVRNRWHAEPGSSSVHCLGPRSAPSCCHKPLRAPHPRGSPPHNTPPVC